MPGGIMTSIPGVDYAWSHPGGAALKAAGKKFACRYLSTDTSKNLSKTEADDLAAHGVACVVVWETTANRALAGSAAGEADAKTALKQATAAGMPAGRPVYFAVDFDATPQQQVPINAYLSGAASVLGKASTGVYGGFYVVQRALDAGVCTWAWQTAAWSGGQWDARAHIRQGAQASIGGVSCDLNMAMAAEFGQWTPGGAPPAPPASNAFPGASQFGPGADNSHVTKLGTMLVARGGARFYTVGPGPKWTQAADGAATTAFQKAQGWTGPDANGIPGPTTWSYLVDGKGHNIPAAAAPSTYTVKTGDTLSAIAAAHGTTVAKLASLNHLANPNLIHPGDIIKIK
jgi:nucleoid-associated protein YgaU